MSEKPWHLIHRAHLHNALRERAVAKEGKGTPAVLRLSSRVASVDPEKAEVTLVSGEVFPGDLVLGADGVHVRRIANNKVLIQSLTTSSRFAESSCQMAISTYRTTVVSAHTGSLSRKKK